MSVGLASFRRRLDALDEQIAGLLGERFEVCREVARHKSEHQIPMMQPARVAQVRARYLERGAQAALPPAFTAELFDGSASIDLVWLGRRRIVGVEPGRMLFVRGRVGEHDGRPAVYNPVYELRCSV